MSAKGLLQGLIWRIGEGRSIKIWQDRWLPTPTSYTVQSHHRVIPDSCIVSMLIDHEVCGWNSGLITEIFNPEEAKVIVTLPLCPTLPPDRLVWRGTTNGIFSVRSAYHMGMEVKVRDNGSTSKEVGGHKVWSTIWRLGVPNNVKKFMWRACNDLLPTKQNLHRRKIVENESCPCCCRDADIHALWNCPAAQDVWGGGTLIFQKTVFVGETFMQLVEFCMGRFSIRDMELMAVLSRRIWLRRNKFIFESIFTPPQVIFSEAVALIDEYRRYNKREDEPITSDGVRHSASAMTLIGIGIVARDNTGNVLGARAVSKHVVAAAKVAESLATLEAVLFCKAASFMEVILKGDAKQVVEDVNSASLNLNAAGHFVDGIKKEILGLRHASVVHVGREANNVAHCLVKEASTHVIDNVWLEEIPSFILHIVLREFSSP
ncbi:uncharacterized protein LOC133856702 [Alnus glutinosa]|uniref:uncharacterized protein LOC133856702 n=1 Tax=Alnus glutinosa TaxID=3517 RepID=UPI002D79A889|nr:uncharacterized protein LOC133856702 [Alnus glutinosa]